MPFVTQLTLQSGDRELVESIVDDIKERAERKGIKLKGPKMKSTDRICVPQYKDSGADESFDPWQYTVYTRVVEIFGHNEFAREVTEQSYPDRIHITADIEQFSRVGDS